MSLMRQRTAAFSSSAFTAGASTSRMLYSVGLRSVVQRYLFAPNSRATRSSDFGSAGSHSRSAANSTLACPPPFGTTCATRTFGPSSSTESHPGAALTADSLRQKKKAPIRAPVSTRKASLYGVVTDPDALHDRRAGRYAAIGNVGGRAGCTGQATHQRHVHLPVAMHHHRGSARNKAARARHFFQHMQRARRD